MTNGRLFIESSMRVNFDSAQAKLLANALPGHLLAYIINEQCVLVLTCLVREVSLQSLLGENSSAEA